MKRMCKVCSKEFETADIRIKYCSQKCRSRPSQRPSKKLLWKPRPCKYCSQLFTASMQRKFCGELCKNSYHNRKKCKYPCICIHCGKSFISYYDDARYCSASCQGLHTPVPIKILVCVDCKQNFEFKGRTKAHRCLDCRKKHHQVTSTRSWIKNNPGVKFGVGSGGNQRGPKNPMWNPDSPYHGWMPKQGYTEPYRHRCWRLWEQQCAIPSCGLKRDKVIIDVHHINGIRSDASLNNLVPLCRPHHTKLHKCRTFKPKCSQDYIARLYRLWPELKEIIKCRIKIAELSGETGTPAIRTEGCPKDSQGQSILGEINQHEAATPQGENICRAAI